MNAVKRKSKIDVDDDSVIAFMRLLWAVDHELRSVSKRMEKSVGVTGPQRLALLILSQTAAPMTAGQLAAELNIHPSTLTGILTRLVAKKLISSDRDPRDARRIVIGLQAAGRRLIHLRQGTVEEGVRKTISNFEKREIATASRVLRTLSASLAGELGRS